MCIRRKNGSLTLVFKVTQMILMSSSSEEPVFSTQISAFLGPLNTYSPVSTEFQVTQTEEHGIKSAGSGASLPAHVQRLAWLLTIWEAMDKLVTLEKEQQLSLLS